MNPQGEQSSGQPAHERRDVDAIGLLLVGALLFLLLAVSFLVCWGILHRLNHDENARQRRPSTPRTAEVASFPAPRLLVHPGQERAKLEGAGRAQLETYGWVDRSAGLARVPIARAMELLVERGLPEVGGGQTRLQLRQARPQTGSPNEPGTSPTPETTP